MQIRLVKVDGTFEHVHCPESGEDWCQQFKHKRASAFAGLILPLELARPGGGKRQFLFGLELLEWLRWSAPDEWRTIPVLALAWQSLECILRRRPTLLLTVPGTTFASAADLKNCEDFAKHCGEDSASPQSNMKFELTRLPRLAAGDFASRTHHDMANLHYGASRLWSGYLNLIKRSNDDHKRDQIQLEILQGDSPIGPVDQGIFNTPWFKQWEACNLHASPRYPSIYGAMNSVISKHCIEQRGMLPDNMRVLLVDDEYDKGFDGVLLAILFGVREGTDTFRREGEFVYAPWISMKDQSMRRAARFVCVRDTELAKCWLKGWSDIPSGLNDCTQNDIETLRFYLKWVLGWSEKHHELLSENELDVASLREAIAQDSLIPMIEKLTELLGKVNPDDLLQKLGIGKPASVDQMKTVVLLDMHLTERAEEIRTFDPDDLPSLQLRKTLNRQNSNRRVPVIFFTASRNVANYLPALEAGSQLDGWFSKEAPDVPVDDENSGRSAAYLLERIYNLPTSDDIPPLMKPNYTKTWGDRLSQFLRIDHNCEALHLALTKICGSYVAPPDNESFRVHVAKTLKQNDIVAIGEEGVELTARLLIIEKMLELADTGLQVDQTMLKKKLGKMNGTHFGFHSLKKLLDVWKDGIFEQERRLLRTYLAVSLDLSAKVKQLDRMANISQVIEIDLPPATR